MRDVLAAPIRVHRGAHGMLVGGSRTRYEQAHGANCDRPQVYGLRSSYTDRPVSWHDLAVDDEHREVQVGRLHEGGDVLAGQGGIKLDRLIGSRPLSQPAARS